MKIICIGNNYNLAAAKNNSGKKPSVFLKPDSAVLLKQHPFVIPEFSEEVFYEIEFLVKINKVGKYISTEFASKYYDEISVGIDFTAVDLLSKQKNNGQPWEIAKAFDGSAVIGEFISKNEFISVNNLTFELKKNANSVQIGNTSQMLFDIDAIISYVSEFFTLKIGDIIFTGTPAGAAKVSPNDVLEGYLEDKKLFRIQVK